MKIRLNFYKSVLSSSFSSWPFSLFKGKIYVQVVLFSALLLFSKPAFAAIDGIVTMTGNGDYLHYCYQDLICSYKSSLQGQPDGLYSDYVNNQPVAFYSSTSGYVDYDNVMLNYARMAKERKSLTINCILERKDIIKANLPDRIHRVFYQEERLIRQVVFIDAQGGETNNQNSNYPPDSAPIDRTGKEVKEEKSSEIEHSKVKTALVADAMATFLQAQTWALYKNAHERFVDIAPVYWEYSHKTGIRPEILYVQAALETGYGHYTGNVPANHNNWAGIKTATGSGHRAEDFESFPTPEDGVRGHFNHMAAYTGLSPLGKPHGRYHTVTRIPWAGTVRYAEDLSGKWAPNPDYHERIVEMVGEIVETAADYPDCR